MKTLFAVGLFVLVAILLQVVCVETQQQQQLPDSNADVEPSCILCQFIVVQLTKIINQSEPEIEKALLKVCKLLPLEAEQVCDTIVLMYGHQLVKLIIKYGKPKVVCEELHLCSRETELVKALTREIQEKDMKCILCRILVGAVEEFLSKNSTEKEIKELLSQACKEYLPEEYTVLCTSLVDLYLMEIIERLKKKYPASVVCAEIRLCSNFSQQMECVACQQIVRIAKQAIQSTDPQQTGLCNQFPPSYTSLCTHTLSKFSSEIIIAIANQESVKSMDPFAVCSTANVCA